MALEVDPKVVDGIKRLLYDSTNIKYLNLARLYDPLTINATIPLRHECTCLGVDSIRYQGFIARVEREFALEIDEHTAHSLANGSIEDLARYVKMRAGSHPEKSVDAVVADKA